MQFGNMPYEHDFADLKQHPAKATNSAAVFRPWKAGIGFWMKFPAMAIQQGWGESKGKMPPAERLAGSNVGFRGPWGTSYAANLRNMAQRASEDRWVQILTTGDGGEGRPPMPWTSIGAMSDRDLRAMYRYIRSLGAKGERAPRAVPPGQTPTTPYVNMELVPAAPAH